MRENEYFCILQKRFGEDLKIESVEWESEWGSTHYFITVYIESIVVKYLQDKKEPERLQEYMDDGIAAVSDGESVFQGDTFSEVVTDLFYYCHEKGYLDETHI